MLISYKLDNNTYTYSCTVQCDKCGQISVIKYGYEQAHEMSPNFPIFSNLPLFCKEHTNNHN
jgi:hypothetical protein